MQERHQRANRESTGQSQSGHPSSRRRPYVAPALTSESAMRRGITGKTFTYPTETVTYNQLGPGS